MKILVQFQTGPGTRWLYRPDEVRKQLEQMGVSVAHAMSEGAMPKVTAIVEEDKPMTKPLTVCAWCSPGVTGPNVSHGICQFHKNAMLAQLPKTENAEQPKSNDIQH
jgi:uncharacterized protein with GYD domain